MTSTHSGTSQPSGPVRTRVPPSVAAAVALIVLAVLLGVVQQWSAADSWFGVHHPASASIRANPAGAKAHPSLPTAGARASVLRSVMHGSRAR